MDELDELHRQNAMTVVWLGRQNGKGEDSTGSVIVALFAHDCGQDSLSHKLYICTK